MKSKFWKGLAIILTVGFIFTSLRFTTNHTRNDKLFI